MNLDWTPLDAELERWNSAGLTLPIWWRDDDAVAATPALARLDELAERLDLTVHIAVVPKHADDGLADVLAGHLVPVVHGWSHQNHSPEGQKKTEFGAHRSQTELCRDAAAGLEKLKTLFGSDVAPMFVPPWNRIDPDILPALPTLGYGMLSTFLPRKAEHAAPGLAQINTHLDPINWRGDRDLVDPETLIAQVCTQLRDRREGRADNLEPYGVLTHHLVHTDAIWRFTEALFVRLLAGPTQCWTALKGPLT